MNPNGPLSNAGSRKDNGQTGRKLVMDYYGPRIPIGGGAIYGKHPTHVDRFGARVARELAVEAVKRGAGECLVRAVYAPNVAVPLDVQVETASGDLRIDGSRLVLTGGVDRLEVRLPVPAASSFALAGSALQSDHALHLPERRANWQVPAA